MFRSICIDPSISMVRISAKVSPAAHLGSVKRFCNETGSSGGRGKGKPEKTSFVLEAK